MSELVEVLMSSDSEGSQSTCSAWDPRTGTNVMAYKGGGAVALHGLSMITNRFVVTANSTKPLIHIWPTNGQEQVSGIRFVTPGKVNALAVSSDGHFLIAGVQESIYIWQICSGKMLSVLSKHFQSITTIKFTDDNSHFISAGQDGAVLVWNLTKCATGDQEPLYSLNDHALPVTDIHIGRGGLRTILFTVSLDRSCRIYNLVNGNLLLNLVLDEGLSAVCVDILENEAFLGTVSGVIYHYHLDDPPRMQEYHMESTDYNNKFLGHNGQSVTCLDLSLDGKILASGGQDGNLYLWDISTKQLIRTLTHKGPITNIKFMLCGKNMFNTELKFNLIACNLKRMKDNEEASKEDVIELFIPETVEDDDEDDESEMFREKLSSNNKLNNNINSDKFDEIKKLKQENENLKKINQSLYNFSIKKILMEEPEINQKMNVITLYK